MCDYDETSLMMYDLFQMVDRLDDGTIPPDLGPLDYKGLYKVIWSRSFCEHSIWLGLSSLYHWHDFQAVGKALFWAHVEGRLKVSTFMLLSWPLWKFNVILKSHEMTYENYAEWDHVQAWTVCGAWSRITSGIIGSEGGITSNLLIFV